MWWWWGGGGLIFKILRFIVKLYKSVKIFLIGFFFGFFKIDLNIYM